MYNQQTMQKWWIKNQLKDYYHKIYDSYKNNGACITLFFILALVKVKVKFPLIWRMEDLFFYKKKEYSLFLWQLCMKCTWTVSWRKPFGFQWACFSRDQQCFSRFPLLLCARSQVVSSSPMSRRPHVTFNSHELVEHFQTKGRSYPAGTDGSPTPNLSEKTKEDSNRKEKKKKKIHGNVYPPPPTISILTPPVPAGWWRTRAASVPSLFWEENIMIVASFCPRRYFI